MPVTNDYEQRLTASLWVNRDKRQRRALFTPSGEFINSDGLLESIALHGVLSPVLCTREGEIIFGERRWTASTIAHRETVPVRYVEDLEPLELRILELEENLRRSDLAWRDECKAIADLHQAYALQRTESGGREWTMRETAQAIQLGESQVSEYLRVAEDLASDRIAGATSVRQAYNTLSRLDERRSTEVLEDIIAGAGQVVQAGLTSAQTPPIPGVIHTGAGHSNAPTPAPRPGEPPPASIPPPESIQNLDFISWAATYTGPRFNLIHCDFPYGIDAFSGPNMHRGASRMYEGEKFVTRSRAGAYDDSESTYLALIEALCANLDRLMAHSAHLMFWLSADLDIMAETKALFAKLAPDLLFWGKPLIWHKTDNAGVLADPKRGPRHVYEACLVASREDRPIVRAVSDAYGAPTDKKWHPSAKPEPVLRHFMAMLVDEHTRLLDPTCGGASALRAAESLGAEQVLGLELNAEHAKSAMTAMRQFRALRSASI